MYRRILPASQIFHMYFYPELSAPIFANINGMSVPLGVTGNNGKLFIDYH